MPDSYLLQYAGTQADLASYVREQPDFGQKGLLTAQYVQSPFTEGALAIEDVGVRKMSFPVILNASRTIPNLGLEDQEALLRDLARPGAVIDVKTAGATTAVRFDVLAGRYEFDYSIYQSRENIRLAYVQLETKPFGYWPTDILLASAASIGMPGQLTWSGSIIGDAPAQFKISVQPTVPTSVPAGTWIADQLAMALSPQASHIGYIRAASLTALAGTASLTGEEVSVASQFLGFALSPTQGGWTAIAAYDLASALEPAHRGRYRAYGWFRMNAAQQQPWLVGLDVTPIQVPNAAFATGMSDGATLPPAQSIGPVYYGADASPAQVLLDLGEVTLPAVASGAGGGQRLRIWTSPATAYVGVATPVLNVGGIYLMPDGGLHLPRGLAIPTIQSPSAGNLMVDTARGQAVLSDTSLNLATMNPGVNAWAYLRGPYPQGTQAVRLDLLGGARRAYLPNFASVMVAASPLAYYKYDELAGPTMVDTMASYHGSYTVTPTLGATGISIKGARFDGASTLALTPPSITGVQATSWSVSLWAIRSSASRYDYLLSQGPNSGSSLTIAFSPTQQLIYDFGDGADTLAASVGPGYETQWSHYVFTWDYTNRSKAIWRNSELLASSVAVSTYRASGAIAIGRKLSQATGYFLGRVDEIAWIKGTALGSAAVRNLFTEGQPGPTTPVINSGREFATVSVHYRPRFQFMKGL